MTGLKACTTFAQTSAQTSARTSAQTSLAPALSEAFGVAQAESKGISLVQLAEIARVLEPQLSPDGRSVAYMLATADWTLNRLSYHLWRQNTTGGAPVALTSGAPGEIPGNTRWSPDGSSILFARAGQLMLIPASGGDARAVTKHATNVAAPAWSPDGRTIYFTAQDPPTAADRERERLRDDLAAFEENARLRHLWSVSVATGDEKQLTSGNLTVASYRLSRDGKQIVLERAPTPIADDAHKGEVWLMNADGTGARQVTRNNVEEQQPELSPDGTQILFISDTNDKFEPYYNTDLFVMPVAGGTPKPAIASFPYAVDQASWAPDGRTIRTGG